MNNIHYKSHTRLCEIENRNRNIVFVIASLTLIVLILDIIGLELENDQLLDVLSYCGLLLTGASLIFQLFNKQDINEIKVQHKNIAEEYKVLRDQFMSLIEKAISNSESEKKLRIKFNKLLGTYSIIGKSSPSTTYIDYLKAQKSLGLGNKSDEEFTWTDSEIDKFLPIELHINDNI